MDERKLGLDNIIGRADNKRIDALQETYPAPVPKPTAFENEWAEEKMAEQLLAKEEPAAAPAEKRKKARPSLGRTNQIKTRLTDSELVQLQRRIKKSGLTQGDFIRNAVLNEQIVIVEQSYADLAMLDDLTKIRAELGRQGGLLKMIVKPNEGQRELAPDEWAALIAAIRNMEQLTRRIDDLQKEVAYGDRQAQGE